MDSFQAIKPVRMSVTRQVHVMVSVKPVRMSVTRQVHVMVSVLLSLADLHCSQCFLFSHDRLAISTSGPPLHRQIDWIQHEANIPQIRGRLATSRDRLATTAAAVPGFRSTVPPRGALSSKSRRARASHSTKASPHSNRTLPDAEVEALAAFKRGIINDPFNSLSSWIVGAAAANVSDPCRGWVGVTCSTQFPNHVVALNLSNLQLVGRLNLALPSLGHLPFLESLDLSVNLFIGSIQGEYLTNFSHLSFFNVSKNAISGEIPSEIGNLVSLKYLDVSVNNITGLLPQSLRNSSLLGYLNLRNNFLEGEIPTVLGRLSGLQYLILAGNLLSGPIPGAIANCSLLHFLDVSENSHIVDALPQEISLLKHLKYFYVNSCYLSGHFPSWIVNLTSLAYFNMLGNNIGGEIPSNIGELQFLEFFSVGYNEMTGILPLSICNLTSLSILFIAFTNMTGPIPPQIGALPKLSWLGLTGGQFTGVIPSSLANCSSLSNLQLGNNELMDPAPIPTWIESLTNLDTLYLSFMNLQGELFGSSFPKLSKLQYLGVAGNNLRGRIPSDFQNCTYLSFLDVGYNQLTGDIPRELGGLKYMRYFVAPNNYFTGPFPEFIVNWTDLSLFYVESNSLSGKLEGRVKIDQFGQLVSFSVRDNDFEGPVPEPLGNSSTINQIFMAGNRLSGPIPSSFANFSSLQVVDLSRNELQGPIPVGFLQSVPELGTLDLSQNKLEGVIPLEIGQLFQLSSLDLSNNKFTGIVPSSIGNCSAMGVLNLAGNQLEGTIPAVAISRMSKSLTILNLSHNLFSGAWAGEFAGLTSIQTLDISSNNISGPIKHGLGNCLDLFSLDISRNNLTGEIPQDLGSLTYLQFFNASFNSLMGPIPQSGIFNSNRINESSFLGNPGLCGTVAIAGLQLPECPPSNGSANHQDCKGFSCKQVYISVSVVGALLLVGSICMIQVGIRVGLIFRRGPIQDDHFQTKVLNFDWHVRYTETDVLQTIDDPRGDNIIGVGGRSIVYRGELPGGQIYALKRFLPNTDRHEPYRNSDVSSETAVEHDELAREAKILGKLKHKNILRCLSFFSNLDHTALIVEYMSAGSLHKQLHETEPCNLSWSTRLKVALGVAEGMKYLHHDFPEPLIHRDLKPSNILLDEDLEPKIADFGTSKFVSKQQDREATASTFCGTMGYMPPEYASQTWISTQGDVYSYGMVIMELLTRRQPCTDTSFFEDQATDLRSWVLNEFNERPLELLDQSLVEELSMAGSIAKKQMLSVLRVSLFCTREQPKSRPSMIDVLGMLMQIVNLGVEPVTRRTVEDLANEIVDPVCWGIGTDPRIEGLDLVTSIKKTSKLLPS